MSIDEIYNRFSTISPKEKISSLNNLNNNPFKVKDNNKDNDEGQSFASFLKDAVKGVNSLQLEADKKIEDLVLKKENITPHEAMIALEKADVAFQLMNTVRTRIVQAYQEVMRMQI
ncbi:MAG: flagellar hook-basal body complex protein FliE [Bdellovibrionota bacterium]